MHDQSIFQKISAMSRYPEAIFIFSAGTVPTENGGERVTTYEESDAFGILGGYDRVEAAALLAKQYPDSMLITDSFAYKNELYNFGFPPARVLDGAAAQNTEMGVFNALELSRRKGWVHICFVSSGFHIPRIKFFFERHPSCIKVLFISSESIIMEYSTAFKEYFEKVKRYPQYQKRLASEQQGIEALRRGVYMCCKSEDKKRILANRKIV